jgi:hypothetical protein
MSPQYKQRQYSILLRCLSYPSKFFDGKLFVNIMSRASDIKGARLDAEPEPNNL